MDAVNCKACKIATAITQFFVSAYNLQQLPPDQGREVAFAGRSNAGKSSALNALTGHKQLARISKTPGRTQLINYFQVAPGCYLVDLPGYGYAKVPQALRRHWQHTLERYLNQRQALQGLCMLMDSRHPLTELDQQLLMWSQYRELPCHILLTKADKFKKGRAQAILLNVQKNIASAFSASQCTAFFCIERHRRVAGPCRFGRVVISASAA